MIARIASTFLRMSLLLPGDSRARCPNTWFGGEQTKQAGERAYASGFYRVCALAARICQLRVILFRVDILE